MSAGTDAFVRLPKADLHLHLEGSARPSTIAELLPAWEAPEPAALTDLHRFFAASARIGAAIRTASDLTRLARELGEDLAADGVVHAEPMFSPQRYVEVVGSVAASVDAVLAGLHAAVAGGACSLGLIVNFDRSTPAAAGEVVDVAIARSTDGVVGVGFAGDEALGIDPAIATACRRARAAGLLVAPHAGESGASDRLLETVSTLRPDRVGHGITAVHSSAAVELLRQLCVTCDVCLTSNWTLGVAPVGDGHPLRRMVDAGVPVTLGSDDALFFRSPLSAEYRFAHELVGLDLTTIASIARHSIVASALPVERRSGWLRAIDAWLDGERRAARRS